MCASLRFKGTTAGTIQYKLDGDQRSIDIVFQSAVDVQAWEEDIVEQYISLDRAVSHGDLGGSDIVG